MAPLNSFAEPPALTAGTVETVAALYQSAAHRWNDMPAFARRTDKTSWEPLSFADLYERGRAIAAGLIDLGVAFQGHVGLFADNRMEWILTDCAVQLCGALNVPRGTDLTDGELQYIIDHASIEICVVENASLWRRVRAVSEKLGRTIRCILFDAKQDGDFLTLAEVETRGAALLAEGASMGQTLESRLTQLRGEDYFTLIYTSGTTGDPKGVPLTHRNACSQLRTIPIPITWRDRTLSILPIWHVYERILELITIHRGACTYYSNVRNFADDLLAVEPTFMASAPRLWETLHARIRKTIAKAHPVRRGLFHIALFLSRHYHTALTWLRGNELRSGPPQPLRRALRIGAEAVRWALVLPFYGFFNAAVLERVRQSVGGCLRGTISGGGALPQHIDSFFSNIGIVVLEGYGLTETSPVLAVRTLKQRVHSTVGPLVAETELRIVDPETGTIFYPAPERSDNGRMRVGEICVRGPQIMAGYYKNPEATAKVMRDSWFHTGDLGFVTWNDCLRITGRCKETIVLSSGENIEPGPIEMKLRQSPLIEQCMVIGQDQKQLGALIVPKREARAQATSEAELKAQIDTEIRNLINRTNGFKPYESIRAFAILDTPFELGEEMTNLFKLRRHIIEETRAEEIASVFPQRDDD